MSRYREVYDSWQRHPLAFWADAAADIVWHKPFDKVFDPEAGTYGRWFVGGEGNTAYNCLDRHVSEGRGDQTAIIYDSPVTGTKRSLTFSELLDEVETFAAVLADKGVSKGDRVVIYMPMVPETVIAMLATARLGAIHSVVFGGFAAAELAVRINDAKPKVVVSASCGVEPGRILHYKPLLDAAIDNASHKPEACIILERPLEEVPLIPGRDWDWAACVAEARAAGRKEPCVPVAATDPLYILYTSGTTGQPKGVVRDNGGHMVALKWSMRNIYDVRPGETYWAASDIGWVVGHSYIVYAPLLNGNATIIYEGKPVGTPDAGAFWRVISEYRPAALFTAPTALRAAEEALEEILEDRAEAHVTAGAASADRAEAIVLGALLGVRQHGVGLADLLEALLGLLVAGVAVGMVGAGEVAVGLLQRRVVGISRDAEDAVKVPGGHARRRRRSPSRPEPRPP